MLRIHINNIINLSLITQHQFFETIHNKHTWLMVFHLKPTDSIWAYKHWHWSPIHLVVQSFPDKGPYKPAITRSIYSQIFHHNIHQKALRNAKRLNYREGLAYKHNLKSYIPGTQLSTWTPYKASSWRHLIKHPLGDPSFISRKFRRNTISMCWNW